LSNFPNDIAAFTQINFYVDGLVVPTITGSVDHTQSNYPIEIWTEDETGQMIEGNVIWDIINVF
jgi:hypothetical protein